MVSAFASEATGSAMTEPNVTEVELRGLIYGALFGENDWSTFLDRYAALIPDSKATLFYPF
jgi:hypothetical protein